MSSNTLSLPPRPPKPLDDESPDESTWLDLLPRDIRERIALFVQSPRYNQTTTALSKVSRKLRSAVSANLKIFDLWQLPGPHLSCCCTGSLPDRAHFCSLAANHAHEIRAPGFVLYTQDVEACFKSRVLVKVVLYDLPDRFYALSYARSVTVLSLKFSRRQDIKAVIRQLKALHLKSLALSTVSPICLHEHFADDEDDRGLIAELFPSLQTVKLMCYSCGGLEHPRQYLWRVMEKCLKAKEVYISEAVPDDAIGRLQNMDRLCLRAAGVFQLLDKVPEKVVDIDTFDLHQNCLNGSRTLNEMHVELLAKCTKLEEFQCLIKPGAERGLKHIMSRLRTFNVEFENSRDLAPDEARHVYEPEEGVLLDAIKLAPRLKYVNLESVRITRRELRGMLESLGERLVEYEERLRRRCNEEVVYTMGTPQEEIHELSMILQTVAQYNPYLKSLMLDGAISGGEKGELDEELIVYEAAVDVLGRRSPFLDVRSLKSLKDRMQNPHCAQCH